MAAIRSYRTRTGERRYEVRFRDADGKHRSRSFSVAKDARSFKLEVERKHQAGTLYQPPSERFGKCAQAWLDRFECGGASLMIAAGCHVKVIAEQMGHADGGALVLKRYGHLYKGARRQAAIATESHVLRSATDPAVGSMRDGEQQAWDV